MMQTPSRSPPSPPTARSWSIMPSAPSTRRPKPPRNWCALIMESHNHAPLSTVVPRGGRQGLIAAHGYSRWIPWLVRENDRPVSVLFGESFFRYMAFPETDPKYDLARFDFD